MRVLGAAVRSGTLLFAVVEPSIEEGLFCTPVNAGSARLKPNKNLGPADRAGDLYSRIAQELRAIKPDRVAVLDTRLYAGWKYADAFDRVSLIAILQLACHDLRIDYLDVKTEPVGRYTKKPAKDLDRLECGGFGFEKPPPYWTTGRAQAFAVAATVAAETK